MKRPRGRGAERFPELQIAEGNPDETKVRAQVRYAPYLKLNSTPATRLERLVSACKSPAQGSVC